MSFEDDGFVICGTDIDCIQLGTGFMCGKGYVTPY